MPPGDLPGEMLRGTSHLKETQRKTQDMLEGLRFSDSLGTPWDSLEELAEVAEKREVRDSLLRQLIPD